jgi:hypothetical protein
MKSWTQSFLPGDHVAPTHPRLIAGRTLSDMVDQAYVVFTGTPVEVRTKATIPPRLLEPYPENMVTVEYLRA